MFTPRSGPWAALFAFGLLGLVGSALRLEVGAAPLVLALGHDLALGVLAFGLTLAVARAPRWLRPLVFGGFLALLGLLLFPEEVAVRAGKLGGRLGLGTGAWSVLLSVSLPQCVLLAWGGAAAVCTLGRRWGITRFGVGLVALSALGLMALNHRVGARAYPVSHFFAALASGAALGRALCELPWAAWISWERRSTRGALALGVGLAILAVAYPPGPGVQAALLRSPGVVVAPLLARLRPAARGVAPTLSAAERPYFESRRDKPSVPPTAPRLLPKDALVVLVTVDALRADVVADPQYRARFPHLSALKARGVVFTEARTTAPQTLPAMAALFTSRYYSQRRWTETPYGEKTKFTLATDRTLSFPAALRRAGVETVHALSVTGFQPRFGVMTGFSKVKTPKRGAKHLVAALARSFKKAGSPRFLYTHLMEPHAPYGRGHKGTPFDRYLTEIERVDRALGKLRAALQASPYRDRYVLIVTGDHGEAFGEHGTHHHAQTVYDELLRVPLIIESPRLKPRVVDEPVSHIDLGPTILDLFGLPTPGGFQGQSLVGWLTGASPSLTRPIIADSSRRMQAMVVEGQKLVRDLRQGSIELYDLGADPGELNNLFEEGNPAHQAFLGRLDLFFKVHTLREPGYEPPYRP